MKLANIREFLSAPDSLDPDDTRRRKLLAILAAGAAALATVEVIVSLVLVAIGIETPESVLRGVCAGLIVAVGSLVVLWLNRRMASGWLPALIFLLIGTIALTFADNPYEIVAGRSLMVFLIPIVMTGVLMPPGSSFLMAGLCGGVLALMTYIVNASLGDDKKIEVNVYAILIFFIIALVSWLSGATVQRALADLRKLNLELEERVRERTRDLAEALSRNAAILEGIADGVIVFDTSGRATTANPAMSKLLNLPLEEIIGRDADALMGQEVGEDDREVVSDLLASKDKSYPGLRFAWGNKVFSTSFASVRDNAGVRTGTVAVFRDFTREAEVERLKSFFVSQVSHELRTPLNAIIGYADMLKEQVYGPLTPEQNNALERIIVNGKRQLSIVNDLLDQAQIEAGTIKLKISLFAPHDLLNDTLGVMDVLAQSKGLTLAAQIAPDMPASLPGDRQRLQQILINLTGNAIKFTDEGSVNIRLYRPDPSHWAMEVSDTGCGIPLEAQEYIFDPFRQVDNSATRRHTGSGLGLSIVKQLVHLMGGEITVHSRVGEGSTFTVLLPLVPVQETENGR